MWYLIVSVPDHCLSFYLATQSSASSADEIRDSGRAFQSLIVWGKKHVCAVRTIAIGSLLDHSFHFQLNC